MVKLIIFTIPALASYEAVTAMFVVTFSKVTLFCYVIWGVDFQNVIQVWIIYDVPAINSYAVCSHIFLRHKTQKQSVPLSVTNKLNFV